MSEKGKYSVTITARSDDRVLTELVMPEQTYSEFVEAQAVLAMALINAGVINADEKGSPVSESIKAMLAKKG